MSENQIQLQLRQKLQQQQQQALSAQQSTLQQPPQLAQVQDQQRQLLDASQNFSRSGVPNQMLEMPQAMATTLPQLHISPQQMTKNNIQTNGWFAHPPQQSKLQQQSGMLPELPGHMGHTPTPTANQLSVAGSSMLTGGAGGGQSGITDDVPSCSTSPSTNNCPNLIQPIMNSRAHRSTVMGEEMTQSSATLLGSSGLETMSVHANLVKDLQQKTDIKPSLNVLKGQNQGFFAPQTYLNAAGAQMDYLDTSSSATSVCISQNDVHLPQNNPVAFNPQSLLFRDTSQDVEVQGDPRNNVPFGSNIDSQLGMPMIPDPLLTKGMSFGVPDMTFNSINSTINDSNFLNTGAWAPPPQFQRMRTYTKVYKRGAVGRSIDITRYSGYEELKQDLARRFGIEGQLEDRQRIGWKLVYVDHENDVLLVGDDPWEEFVNCVRCIKILSPQEVQQMSLDGDFGNSILPNQACSSSDGGNV
ncbi:hypothetical protein F0562_030821 [Nyssa sinensis]|uniref:Auxin-responsive protein n=1 Tax=Nyssa sinensis TaxID=561372 RepID=A0A5J5AZQ0_9ASTE|nr:hypothetical protein F0562_030821 [Nyssa sinensis]